MKRLAVPLLLLAQIGCLRPFTSRLDQANEHLENLRTELQKGIEQLAASNERLREMEKYLADVTQRMQTMERFMKRFGATADPEEEGLLSSADDPPLAPPLPALAAPR
jgi:hypothetical protein